MLNSSREIMARSIEQYKPYAICSAISGGDDSITAYYVLRELGYKPDYIIHVNTRTGIRQTTEFVRQFARDEGIAYLEGDAGDNYEKYVLRKGFFGQGRRAHNYAYHLLKHRPLRKVIAENIRHGQRGRNVLLVSGIRNSESDNRKYNFTNDTNRDASTPSTIWANPIRHWSKSDCLNFLERVGAKRNPVTVAMNRSGECLCGTMQSEVTRAEAEMLYPEWGRWLSDLEKRVKEKHGYGWGVDVPRYLSALRAGQTQFDFAPMCAGCKLEYAANPPAPDAATKESE